MEQNQFNKYNFLIANIKGKKKVNVPLKIPEK